MTKDFLITLDEEKESHAEEEKVNNDKEIEEKEVKMAKEIELKDTETIGNKISRFSSDYNFLDIDALIRLLNIENSKHI